MSTTCVQRRSEAVEPLNTLPVAAARLAVELEETIARFVDSAGDENLGHGAATLTPLSVTYGRHF